MWVYIPTRMDFPWKKIKYLSDGRPIWYTKVPRGESRIPMKKEEVFNYLFPMMYETYLQLTCRFSCSTVKRVEQEEVFTDQIWSGKLERL